MFVEVKQGDAPVIIGRDEVTGVSALVFGEITFVADSDAAVRQLHEGIARWHASLANEDPFTMPSVDPYALVLDELVSAIDDSDRVLATLSDAAPYDHKEHAVRHALMKARSRLEARS